jgi:hypothetical protein
VTFSTPTGDYTSNRVIGEMGMFQQQASTRFVGSRRTANWVQRFHILTAPVFP